MLQANMHECKPISVCHWPANPITHCIPVDWIDNSDADAMAKQNEYEIVKWEMGNRTTDSTFLIGKINETPFGR